MVSDHDPQKLRNLRGAGANYLLTADSLRQPAQWQRKIHEVREQIRPCSPH
jgi:hypothetical protein